MWFSGLWKERGGRGKDDQVLTWDTCIYADKILLIQIKLIYILRMPDMVACSYNPNAEEVETPGFLYKPNQLGELKINVRCFKIRCG